MINRTYQYRLRSGPFGKLNELASKVNFVWNCVNQTYEQSVRRYFAGAVSKGGFISYNDFTSYLPTTDGFGFTKGASIEVGLPQTMINRIAKQYADAIKVANRKKLRRKLRWRKTKTEFEECSIPFRIDSCSFTQIQDSKTGKFYGTISVRCNRDILKFRTFKDRKTTGTPKEIIFKRDKFGRWKANVVCVDIPVAPAKNNKNIGVDVGGVKNVYCSNGYSEDAINPERLLRKRRMLKRSISRKEEAIREKHNIKRIKGKESVRLIKARKKLQKLEYKIARIRADHTHKTTSNIAKEVGSGFVFVEKLKIKNMTRSGKGTFENPGKNVKAKSGLNKSFLNAAPYETKMQLKYKTEVNCGELIEVSAYNTSQRCPKCKDTPKSGELSHRRSRDYFECRKCEYAAHADYIGAQNILDNGLQIIEKGKT